MVKDDIVDVIAICQSFGQVENKRLSNGSPGRSRVIWLIDESWTKVIIHRFYNKNFLSVHVLTNDFFN